MLSQSWDAIIAFPPCTHLACSGARHFKRKAQSGEQLSAIKFFNLFAYSDCGRLAIENPVGIMSSLWRKPDQIVQPWQFGHGVVKTTCLWLKNLPLLRPTEIVRDREEFVLRTNDDSNLFNDRAKQRGLTFQGVADAMGKQWGNVIKLIWTLP